MKKMKYSATTIVAGALLAAVGFVHADEDFVKKADGDVCLVKADKVTGAHLWDYHGNQIGTIKDVMLAPTRGAIYAIVDAGKMLEQERVIAVPWSKLTVSIKDGTRDKLEYSLDTNKATLATAPTYDPAAPADLTSPALAGLIDRHWGVYSRDSQEKSRAREETKETDESEKPQTEKNNNS